MRFPIWLADTHDSARSLSFTLPEYGRVTLPGPRRDRNITTKKGMETYNASMLGTCIIRDPLLAACRRLRGCFEGFDGSSWFCAHGISQFILYLDIWAYCWYTDRAFISMHILEHANKLLVFTIIAAFWTQVDYRTRQLQP
jgi:hypothetical protein